MNIVVKPNTNKLFFKARLVLDMEYEGTSATGHHYFKIVSSDLRPAEQPNVINEEMQSVFEVLPHAREESYVEIAANKIVVKPGALEDDKAWVTNLLANQGENIDITTGHIEFINPFADEDIPF